MLRFYRVNFECTKKSYCNQLQFMKKRIFKPAVSNAINPHLDNLEAVQQKVEEIINEKDKVINSIREGFVECVVVFIDLVDSTKFKIEHSKEPERWILRVKQFGDIIKEYVENSNGKVVKYIAPIQLAVSE